MEHTELDHGHQRFHGLRDQFMSSLVGNAALVETDMILLLESVAPFDRVAVRRPDRLDG